MYAPAWYSPLAEREMPFGSRRFRLGVNTKVGWRGPNMYSPDELQLSMQAVSGAAT